MIEAIIEKNPQEHIFNVGNENPVSVFNWAKLCYEVSAKDFRFKNVMEDIEQRNYFSFYNYEYTLDVSRQKNLLEKTVPLKEGLLRSYEWFKINREKVVRKNYLEYIDKFLAHK